MAVDAYTVEAKHWSLMLAGFAKGAEDGVNKDIPYDHKTFLLDEVGLKRLNQLCRFDNPRREGAPINKPQEWSKYSKIISDPELSEEDRTKYIDQILAGAKPSEVLDEIVTSREIYDWEKWLQEMLDIVVYNLNDIDIDDENTKDQINRLFAVIEKLENKSAS